MIALSMRNELISISVLGASGPGPFWTTLIGAVVGGAVSLCTTLLVERQKLIGASEEEKRRALASGKLAARVVTLELRDIESVLRVSLERSPFNWPPTTGYSFPTAAWSEYGSKLGVVLPDDRWNDIALPYSAYAYSNLFGTVSQASAQTLLDETQAAIDALEGWGATTMVAAPGQSDES